MKIVTLYRGVKTLLIAVCKNKFL